MAIPLRPLAGGIARALAFLLLFFLLQAAIVSLFGQPLQWLAAAMHDPYIASGVASALSALAATAIMLRSIDVRPWSDVGLGADAARPRAVLEGLLLGGLTIGAACGALLAFGWLHIVPAPPGSSFVAAARISAFLLPAALAEELVSRGYLLTAIRDGTGARIAVVFTSLLFGVAHVQNPGATVESVVNVTLAGVFLAAVRLAFDSLYAAWAAHAAWNWIMAVPFHASVSGLALDAPDYRTVSDGPVWATGGTWGPEGGVAAAVGMLAGLFYLYHSRHRRAELSQSRPRREES
ncbi:MAG: CPBP family intramembrane metalloprotease [Gemmatimonadetes bacterium]|nr:CPBP family intramembrane metalloprotease [Gemmatimonadota bacterium]